MGDLVTVDTDAKALALVKIHNAVLYPVATHRDGPGWSVVEGLDFNVRVDQWTKLIPAADIPVLAEALKRTLVPIERAQAIDFAQRISGAFPQDFRGGNPQAYANALTGVMGVHPPDVVAQAAVDIIKSFKFRPSAAEVHDACNRITLVREFALRVLVYHLAEHERRAGDRRVAESLSATQEEREAGVRRAYESAGMDPEKGYQPSRMERAQRAATTGGGFSPKDVLAEIAANRKAQEQVEAGTCDGERVDTVGGE